MKDLDVKSFALGFDDGARHSGDYPEPTGTKHITENGLYNIKDYAKADVNVPTDEPDLVDITITQNGTYNHPNKDGYDEVVVNVPSTPAPTGTISITQNGTYDVTDKASANVNVEGGGYPEPTGTISISSNGTTNVKDYASANVNVPNTYSSGDSGKVVSNGELVSQTSTTKTANGTYDTTLNNSVTINVPTDEPDLEDITITQNGRYISTEHDGYDVVEVNVPTVTPTGKITITSNDVDIDVSEYAYADVEVPSGDTRPGLTYSDYRKYENNGWYTPSKAIYKMSGYVDPLVSSGNYIATPQLPNGMASGSAFNHGPGNDVEEITFTNVPDDYQIYLLDYFLYRWFALKTIKGLDFTRVKRIGASAFYNCKNLDIDTVPNATTYIGSSAFYGCEELSWTSLPSSVQTISGFSFSGCKKLAITHIPASVETINNSAFQNCTNLKIIIFDGTPTSMPTSGAGIFSGCTSITDIYVPWSSGDITVAFGVPNATIHYDYTE